MVRRKYAATSQNRRSMEPFRNWPNQWQLIHTDEPRADPPHGTNSPEVDSPCIESPEMDRPCGDNMPKEKEAPMTFPDPPPILRVWTHLLSSSLDVGLCPFMTMGNSSSEILLCFLSLFFAIEKEMSPVVVAQHYLMWVYSITGFCVFVCTHSLFCLSVFNHCFL